MLDAPPTSVPPRDQNEIGRRKPARKEGWVSRLARRLVFRMEVGTSERPATLYLASFDMIPMGSWVVVPQEEQSRS
ncbi:MAG TPA: hypothetical protein QF409_07225 [Acidimicrobiales bacterium]|jgi:hypothetical protein|nr:hypothetical protein [Acidimicrobiales bacterium]